MIYPSPPSESAPTLPATPVSHTLPSNTSQCTQNASPVPHPPSPPLPGQAVSATVGPVSAPEGAGSIQQSNSLQLVLGVSAAHHPRDEASAASNPPEFVQGRSSDPIAAPSSNLEQTPHNKGVNKKMLLKSASKEKKPRKNGGNGKGKDRIPKPKPFVCNKCPRRYEKSHLLKRHKDNDHPVNGIVYRCLNPECKRSGHRYKVLESFLRHFRGSTHESCLDYVIEHYGWTIEGKTIEPQNLKDFEENRD